MSIQFAEALNQLVREKRLDRKLLLETLAAGLSSAVKKKYGAGAEIDLVEDKHGKIEIYMLKTVVETVENGGSEISMADAKEHLEDPKIGDQVRILLPFESFGRNAIQITKQILTQKLREFERDRTYEEYKDRIGDIVSGSVQQIDRNSILVNLGNAEAIMPRKEQIRRERYNQGSSLRACIVKVDKEARGPMITLSRTSPEFLKKLFSHEVPEIYDGLIDIKSVAREAGGRSKIAVYSRDERVDAVGACVGMKGSRVQAVVNELSGERIDIVPWSEEVSAFVSRALSPAKIAGVRVSNENRTVLVIVEEDQLSLAIGKEGQNVRLASKLTNWQIELVSSRELEQRERLQEQLIMSIEDMVGVSAKMAENLKTAGIPTVQKLMKTSPEEILAVQGIGEKTAEKLLATGEKTMKELDLALEELIRKENEERELTKKEKKPLFDESLLDDGSEVEAVEDVEPATAPLTEENLFKEPVEEDDDEEVGAQAEPEGENDTPADDEPGEK